MNATKKRKLDSDNITEPGKRLKMTPETGPSMEVPRQLQPQPQSPGASHSERPSTDTQNRKAEGKKRSNDSGQQPAKPPPRQRMNKLNAPRPFPTVPTSVSATGPRSSHREGTNMMCITRKTSLGNYMRRCKNVILKDGYKTLHFSAMGAAIPLLLQLVCALPPILPFPQDEIRWEVTTGSVEVQDEMIPEDDDDDLTYQTRSKSVLSIVFKIGNGEFEGDRTAVRKYSAGKSVPKSYRPPRGLNTNTNANKGDPKGKGKATEEPSELVYEEPEQEYMDAL